ncbi:hypothetical protein B0H14DRAFT_2563555 [Mycena olivaceomarginata]|nr:hypothetical protein B0H14DRAFT_2563555 [Mycena olivaceomarginata]
MITGLFWRSLPPWDNYIPASIQTSEQLKHYKHAEAQRRYARGAPTDATRTIQSTRTAEAKAEAAESVMPVTPTIVNLCAKGKFIAKFGADAFFNYYVPQHKLRGADFLPGLAREYAQQTQPGTWGARRCERGGGKGRQNRGRKAALREPRSPPKLRIRSLMVGVRYGANICSCDSGRANVLMMSSPEWDQSRAQSQPSFRSQPGPLSDQMACPMPFFPKSTNYVGTGEHDKNPRKYWYLVLNQGVFTKKLMQIRRQRVLPRSIFFSRVTTLGTSGQRTAFGVTLTTATRSWTPRRMATVSKREDDSAPSVRLDLTNPGRQNPRSRSCAPDPRRPLLRAHPLRTADQGHPSPKARVVRAFPCRQAGAPSRTPVKKEFVLPLYRDDTPHLRNGGRPCPYRRAAPPLPTPVKTRETPPVALSSSVELGVLPLADVLGRRVRVRPACGASSIALPPPRPCSHPGKRCLCAVASCSRPCLHAWGLSICSAPFPGSARGLTAAVSVQQRRGAKLYKDAKKGHGGNGRHGHSAGGSTIRTPAVFVGGAGALVGLRRGTNGGSYLLGFLFTHHVSS